MKIGTPLCGARVRVRDYRKSDLPFCTGLWFDAENGRYMSDPPAGCADAVYQRALDGMEDNAEGYYFVIERAGTGERIGTCCAFPYENGERYDIGYCIQKSQWRHGYGEEAVRLLMAWAAARGARKMSGEVAAQNAASCGLLEKLGFSAARESAFRKYNTEIRFPSRIYERQIEPEQAEGEEKGE